MEIRKLGFHVRPYFRWYDLWIGAYVDTEKHKLYVQPLPMFGLVFKQDRDFKFYMPLPWEYNLMVEVLMLNWAKWKNNRFYKFAFWWLDPIEYEGKAYKWLKAGFWRLRLDIYPSLRPKSHNTRCET